MSKSDEIIERFPALQALNVCRAAFVKRVPGIDITGDKAAALNRLEAAHDSARHDIGMGDWPLVTAEQVHGNRVLVVDSAMTKDEHITGYDGFATNQRSVALGVHVADCCAVYIVDPKTPAV